MPTPLIQQTQVVPDHAYISALWVLPRNYEVGHGLLRRYYKATVELETYAIAPTTITYIVTVHVEGDAESQEARLEEVRSGIEKALVAANKASEVTAPGMGLAQIAQVDEELRASGPRDPVTGAYRGIPGA